MDTQCCHYVSSDVLRSKFNITVGLFNCGIYKRFIQRLCVFHAFSPSRMICIQSDIKRSKPQNTFGGGLG